MVKRISIELLTKCFGNKDYVKALAFAIRFKTIRKSSIVKNYSVNRLAEVMHCGWTKANKMMAILEELGLVRYYSINGIKFMRIIPLRMHKFPRGKANYQAGEHRNLFSPENLDCIIPSNIDTANEFLMRRVIGAFFIKINADRISYYKNRIENDIKPKQNKHPKRESAKNLCLKYNEYGIARKTIKSSIECGNSICSDIVNIGVKFNLFLKVKRILTFDKNNMPVGVKVVHNGERPYFYNKKGQLCIAFANCYLSTKPEFITDSIVTRNEILSCM